MLTRQLAEVVRRDPAAIAIVCGAERTSYATLFGRILRRSRELRALGMGPGSVVGVLSENTPEFAVTFFAIAHNGGVLVPLNTSFKEQELKDCLETSGASALYFEPAFAELAERLSARVPQVRLHQVEGGVTAEVSSDVPEASELPVHDGALVCLFSSGSSGRPKRLLRTQANYWAEVQGYSALIELSDADRTLCTVPLYHSYGIGNCLLHVLLTGGKLVLPGPSASGNVPMHQRIAELMTLIETQRITVLPSVPFIFRALAEQEGAVRTQLASLRHCFSSGNFLPEDVRRDFLARFGISIRSIYGCSEAGTVAIEPTTSSGSAAGQLLPGYQARIRELAKDEQVTAGVGEIEVSGPGLTSGYPDLPDESAQAFKDHFFVTGDLGYLTPEGLLLVTGRRKLLIDTGGRKVDPMEVEDVIAAHPLVREAVVLGVQSGRGNEIVKVVVVAQAELTAQALKAYCSEKLADYKVPRIVEFRSEIPKTPTGKILRKSLVSAGDSAHEMRDLLFDIIRTGFDHVKSDPRATARFSELGIDSITIFEINAVLSEYFDGLPKTLLFEYERFSDLAAYLRERDPFAFERLRKHLSREPVETAVVVSTAGDAEVTSAHAAERDERTGNAQVGDEDIAIVGIAGSFPDARNLEELWESLRIGHDAIREIPASRFAIDEHFDAQHGAPGKTYGRWGGFLTDVAGFDPLFFNIAPGDAALIDPQERLFLQTSWHALEDSGHTQQRLAAETVAVFVGVMYDEYQLLGDALPGKRVQSALHASIANRLSYFMGFRGPSMAVDTMCSSSLSALFLACESMHRGHATMAVVGGVNLSLHPRKYLQTAQGHFLSSDGRCRSFGEGGDGYVPGEGVVSLVLKPLSRALADGDRVRGVIAAASVNHGGHTNGYTVPSPHAQADVIVSALRRAGVRGQDIDYVEAHGTGTALGDPIEVSGLAKAIADRGGRTTVCPIGSIKSNIGHLEAAAGAAGIAKVLLQFEHDTLVPSLHSARLNPNADFEASPFRVQRELKPWPGHGDGRRRVACVSSFGAGGSNAHVVLREAPALRAASTDFVPVFLISAKSGQALKAYVARWIDWLSRGARDLAALAYTSQVGREAFAHRLAVRCESAEQLLSALHRWSQQPENTERTYSGIVAANRVLAAAITFQRHDTSGSPDFDLLAKAWAEGANVDWRSFYEDPMPRMASIPQYPFDNAPYWIEQTNPARESGAMAMFKPVWEAAPAAPSARSAVGRVLFLVPSQEVGRLCASALRENAGRWTHPQPSEVIYVVPRADEGADAWLTSAFDRDHRPDEGALTLEAWLRRSADLTVVIDVLDGPRALPALIHERLSEMRSLRRLLTQVRTKLGSWNLAVKDGAAGAAALSGIRTQLAAQLPGVSVRTIRYGHADLSVAAFPLVKCALASSSTVELKLGAGPADDCQVRSMHKVASSASVPFSVQPGVHVISGGLGGLGWKLARDLSQSEGVVLCLLGRSPLGEANQARMAELAKSKARVVYHAVDVTDAVATAATLQRVRAEHGPIRGVFHGAGVADVEAAEPPSTARDLATLSPKVAGTLSLDAATADDALDFFFLFASTSAWLGDFGHGAYAVGNRFQVEFAAVRNSKVACGERRGHTCALGLPLVRDGGMKLHEAGEALLLRASGLRHLEWSEALRAMAVALQLGESSVFVLSGVEEAVARVARRAFTVDANAPVTVTPALADTHSKVVPRPSGSVLAALCAFASELTSVPQERLDLDESLGNYGFDSIRLSELSQRISARFQIDVLPTVFFAHGTLRALAAHVETLAPVREEVGSPESAASPSETDLDQSCAAIAVIGMSGRFPGAKNLEELWDNLVNMRVSVSEIPAERWDLNTHYGEHVPEELRTSTKWGGFITGADAFDARFFRISPREAQMMDPQQRLFLMQCWHALEDAGCDPLSLAGEPVGVFVGAQFQDYAALLAAAGQINPLVSTGNAHSLLANRVSYLLDLHGPSEAVDTACSSSLVALHRAMEAIRHGEAELALAGGVSLMFDPTTYIGADKLGVLSKTGACRTFDAGADGYARGEGVGVVVLKALDRAVADGDRIYCVVRGSGVRHAGKATSLTAPNSRSQARLIHETHQRAGFEAGSIGYIEAHGTGTVLGDPVEVEGVQHALGPLSVAAGGAAAEVGSCAMGSIKANIGHLEPAAGIAGFIKTALALHHKILPGNPALKEVNPYLKLAGTPVRLLRETEAWSQTWAANGKTFPRRAGVSSFGYGGVNAHVALEEWLTGSSAARSVALRPVAFVVSARDRASLLRYVDAHLTFIEQHRESLADAARFQAYAFTCQVGRSALRERFGVVVQNVAQLEGHLRAFRAGDENCPEISNSAAYHEQGAAALARVLARWMAGEEVDWNAEWAPSGVPRPQRSAAPRYPFATDRHWIEPSDSGRIVISTRAPERSETLPVAAEPVGAASHAAEPRATTMSSTTEGAALDALLIELTAQVAKLPATEISASEELAEYGFQSIMMVELCKCISDRLGVDLKADVFFELPRSTLAALSDAILSRFRGSLKLTSPASTPVVQPSGPVEEVEAEVGTQGPAQGLRREGRNDEPIAIVGASGMLPGSPDLDAFYQNLLEGKHLISDVPSDRWDFRDFLGDPRKERNRTDIHVGGFVAGVDEFDAKFFGISPKEAELMDPQQRLFLTTVWRAIEDAGYRASDLRERTTALFVGVSANDYQELARDYDVDVDAYTASGIAHSVLANRVSYALDLTGPSEPVDTACSASLIAIHRGVELLQAGRCGVAIAGGVNLILNPRLYIAFSKAGMLSPDGRCGTFDSRANGYVRGEGVGALVLKRLSDAERDGDHVYAVIRGSATNHGGHANSLTAPNVNAQSELLLSAYERAGVDPTTISYIEAHGTGTPLGDPVEVNALKRAFQTMHERAGRTDKPQAHIGLGSVKTNIGHLETASGIAGVLKVVLAMNHGTIPGQLHFEKLNPLIDLKDTPFFIVDRNRPWNRLRDAQGQEVPRRAGVSSFGFGGANAHVVLEEYRAAPPAQPAAPGPQLLVLSAQTEASLEAGMQALLKWLHARSPRAQLHTLGERLRLEASQALGVPVSEIDPEVDLRDYGMEASALSRLSEVVVQHVGEEFAWTRCGSRYAIARVLQELGHVDVAPAASPLVYAPPSLRDIAYTLQVGREPFDHRLSMVCDSLSELEQKLTCALRAEPCAGTFRGRVQSKRVDRVLQAERDARALQALQAREPAALVDLAKLWVEGAAVSFASLHPAGAQRISLPTYAFEPTRHWLARPARNTQVKSREVAPAAAEVVPHTSWAPPLEGDAELVLSAMGWQPMREHDPHPQPGRGDVVLSMLADPAAQRAFCDYVSSFGATCISIARATTGYREEDGNRFFLDLEDAAQCGRLWQEITARFAAPTQVVHGLHGAGDGLALRELTALCRAIIEHHPRRAVRVCHVASARSNDAEGIAAFARSIQFEKPWLHLQVASAQELGDGGLSAECLWRAVAGPNPTTRHVRLVSDVWQQAVLRPVAADLPFEFRKQGTYLITGGAAGLGLTFAKALARHYSARLVLLGRSSFGPKQQEVLEAIAQLGGEALYCEADVADAHAVAGALAAARARFGTLHGVLHAAGVTRDGLLARKSDEDIRAVLAPKVDGCGVLDAALADTPLDFFAVFSSVTSLLGNIGQTDYAYANGYLNAFAESRERLRRAGARYGASLSIAWQFWGPDGGMVTPEPAQRWMWDQAGMVALHAEVGLLALKRALASGEPTVGVFYGDRTRVLARLAKTAELSAEPMAAVAVAAKKVAKVDKPARLTVAAAISREDVGLYLAKMIAEESKTPLSSIDRSEELEKYGIDSVMIATLNQRLSEEVGELPQTLMFEYPTIDDLAGYFFTEHLGRMTEILGQGAKAEAGAQASEEEDTSEGEHALEEQQIFEDESPAAPPAVVHVIQSEGGHERAATVRHAESAPVSNEREPLAIVGVAGRYPMAANVSELWNNLLAGRDCVTEVPSERWDHAPHFNPDRKVKGKAYSRWGGFLQDADRFDARYFGIAPVEARFLDPQERLFLEVATEALQDAGYNRASLRGRGVGVFVGVMYSQYQLHAIEQTTLGNPTVLGDSYASIANRVSYWYDLHGPSLSLDTMCSSSLTALHYASRAIWCGDCEAAIVGGVNLSIHPYKYVSLSEGQFLSSDGKCRSFGEGGDGYVPGEGIGAVIVKPLRAALEAGDHIYGVVKGVAVNHGGKTNGYSVPNPRAQAEVVRSAWLQAGIDGADVDYIEAHGTGTSLGDPIEIAALSKAFGAGTESGKSCPIGSIKASVGHLEAAAGVVGITKVLLQMKHDTLVPSLHCEPENPNLRMAKTPFVVQRARQPWRRPGRARTAVVSSFGAGGSNAHAVIEDSPQAQPRATYAGQVLFVCSARSQEQLLSYVTTLRDFVRDVEPLELHDLCFTLQVGRDELTHRVAIVAQDQGELLQFMTRFLNGEAESHVHAAEVTRNEEGTASPEQVLAWVRASALDDVAKAWVRGATVRWVELASSRQARRISAPTYPFAKTRYWFSSTQDDRSEAAVSLAQHVSADVAKVPTKLVTPLPAQTPSSEPQAVLKRTFRSSDTEVRDHVVQGKLIAPGAAVLGMALRAHESGGVATLKRFSWLRPVLLEADSLELNIRPANGKPRWMEAASSGSAGDTIHASWEQAHSAAERPARLDIPGLLSRLQKGPSSASHYERYTRAGIAYGPSFQRVEEIFVGSDEVLVRIEGAPQAVDYHIQTVDAALQAVALLAEAEEPGRTYVPFAIGLASMFAACPFEVWAHVARKRGGFDIVLADGEGHAFLTLSDFYARVLSATKPAAATAPRLQAALPSAHVSARSRRFFFRPTWFTSQPSTGAAT